MSMRIVKTGDPDVLELRLSRFVQILGIAFFLLMGAFFVSISWGWITPDVSLSPKWFGVFGVLCISIAVVAMFLREGIAINRREGVVIRWWGILSPMIRRTHDLASFDRVIINRELRSSGSGAGAHHVYFPVRLEGEGRPVTLDRWNANPSMARKLAEEVAAFLDYKLVDRSGS